MEDAIVDCRSSDLHANTDMVQAWDEAVAFYVGSEAGEEAGTSDYGNLLYALADKRCSQFGTCNANRYSRVNEQIMALFAKGQALLASYECDAAEVVKESIVKQMLVPQIQGLVRYLYMAYPKVCGTACPAKEKAELWAFAAAVLPVVHAASPTVAKTLRSNAEYTMLTRP